MPTNWWKRILRDKPWKFLFFLIVVLSFAAGSAKPFTTLAAGSFESEGIGHMIFLPAVITKSASNAAGEWTQEAHDFQRSGYTTEEPAEPWSFAWTWNGPDGNGGTGGHFYNAPAQAHSITGGSNVYVPAGNHGLYALRKSDGSQAWHISNTSFNAAPAYANGYLYAGGADGKLYKINASNGSVASTYLAGSPLNRAVLLVGTSVYVVTESGVLHRVNTSNMASTWKYSATSGAATPASYSPSRKIVIFATNDLYIHAVRVSDGGQAWRVKPTTHNAQYPFTFEGFWPVIAEQHGLVFVRLNLGMNALWSGPNIGPGGGGVYPSSNADTRAFLNSHPDLKNLFALNLDNGSESFIPAVGFGGVETLSNNSPDLEAPPMPVVKVLSNGKEVAYLNFRSGQGSPIDGRWDSHLGEMVLDDSTVPGLVAGDLRFIESHRSYIGITDEQTPMTMAGNTLFNAHWGASESNRITDRSNNKGLTHDNPISTAAHPTVIRRQQSCSSFDSKSHWTSCGLTLFDDGRYWSGPGWWVYWNVLDPPTPSRGAYSDGNLPRYTYVSDGLIIVQGNGGELFVLNHSS